VPHKLKNPPLQRDVLRLPVVQSDWCPLCESQIRNLIEKGEFPAPIPIGPRAVAWLRTDLEAWRDRMVVRRAEQLERRAARRAEKIAALTPRDEAQAATA